VNISIEKVEVLQAKHNLTAKKLAEIANISRQTLSTIKKCRTCRPTTAAKIAKAFNVDVTDILTEVNR
jgi:DNA-binding XRE family transcriptional regulator